MHARHRVALAFNLKRVTPQADGTLDDEAEYDSPKTVQAIADAIASLGHEVVLVEADERFPVAIAEAGVDVVFNIAEGAGGRSREAQVPAVLEMLRIPYTGSDPASLVLTLDKALAKAVVHEAGVRVAGGIVMHTGAEELPLDMDLPMIVKPVAEGSSKGVLASSLAWSEDEVRMLARSIAQRYGQGALVEEYLPGREFTVGIVGYPTPVVYPPMEIVFAARSHGIYTFEHKLAPTDEVRYEAPAKVSDELRAELERTALTAFCALGCRDVARIDLRLDRDGNPTFIECNPLPGLTPHWSDLCLITEPCGVAYEQLVGRILDGALARGRRAAPTIAAPDTQPSIGA